MMMKHLTMFFGVCLALFVNAQGSIRPADLIKQNKESFAPAQLFSKVGRNTVTIPDDITNYQLLQMDQNATQRLLQSDSKALSFSVPIDERNNITLELVEVQLPSFLIREAPAMQVAKYQGGKHYRGIIKGQPNSVASLSVFDGEVMALCASPEQEGNLVLGKVEGSDIHIIYRDFQIQDKFNVGCATPDNLLEEYQSHELHGNDGSRALTDCVGLYFEVDYDIYQDKGSNTTNVSNFVTGLYNQVATMYANENINTNISEIVVWTATSPYSGNTSSQMLNAFTGYRTSFNGDLGMLLSYQASGGIAYVNGICNNSFIYKSSFSSIDPSYATVPTYSWSVMVVTHEFGHLMGSKHTHACVWNGNNTAIDGCYTTEGSCSQPSIPSNGGTVMSYCHLTSVGINLSNGFGPQPGNVIRSRVSNANCLSACGNPPPPPPSCNENEATLTIVTDNYPGETTWQIRNSSGSVLYSGGPYSTANATNTIALCLPDGCFDFVINDSYGDGICCGYGSGSYNITYAGNSLASGGQFGSTETKNFCINAGGGGGGGNGTTVLAGNYFESGWDGWIDGGSDCYRYSGSFSYEGSYSIRLRDNSGIASSMTSPTFDLRPYNNVDFEFYFYANSMEPGESFFVEFFNGSSWSNIGTYTSGSTFNNNTFYVSTLTVNAASNNFSSNNRFRITCDASTNSDQVYIDAITITGTTGSNLRDSDDYIWDLGQFGSSVEDGSVILSPNPASTNIYIQITDEEENSHINAIDIYDMMGRKVQTNLLSSEESVSVDISNLNNGAYIMRIYTDGDEAINKRFTVMKH